MNTNTAELKKAANDAVKTLKILNKAYNKQKQQVEEMYAFFTELLNIISAADSKGNSEVKEVTWSIRTALLTYMMRIKSIGEKE